MLDTSQNSEFFPHEIPRNERPKEPSRIVLTPELRAALEKVLEQLQEFLTELR